MDQRQLLYRRYVERLKYIAYFLKYYFYLIGVCSQIDIIQWVRFESPGKARYRSNGNEETAVTKCSSK